jgi:hypothetical protein
MVIGRGNPEWSRKNMPQYHPTWTHSVLNAGFHSHTKEISGLFCRIAHNRIWSWNMYNFNLHWYSGYFLYDPVSKAQTNPCFRTACDNGGDVARICCDVTFTSLARSHWRQEHRPCDADSLPCITHPSSAAVALIQSLPLLSHLAPAQDGPPDTVLQQMVIFFVLVLHSLYRAILTKRHFAVSVGLVPHASQQPSAAEYSWVRSSEVESSRGMSSLTHPQLHCTWRSFTEILLKTNILGLLSKHLKVSS